MIVVSWTPSISERQPHDWVLTSSQPWRLVKSGRIHWFTQPSLEVNFTKRARWYLGHHVNRDTMQKHQPANPPSYRFNQRCNKKSDLKINKSSYPFESEEVQGNLYILYFVEPHVTPLAWLQKTQHRWHRQSRILQTILHEYYQTTQMASSVTNTTDSTTWILPNNTDRIVSHEYYRHILHEYYQTTQMASSFTNTTDNTTWILRILHEGKKKKRERKQQQNVLYIVSDSPLTINIIFNAKTKATTTTTKWN